MPKNPFFSSSLDKVHDVKRPGFYDEHPFLIKRKRHQPEDDDPDLAQVQQTFMKDKALVEMFGAQFLSHRQKKDFEKRQLGQLGLKEEKNQKVPLKILKGMRAKHKERTEKRGRIGSELVGGLTMKGIENSLMVQHTKMKKLERQKRSRGLSTSEGAFRGGVLHVSKRLLHEGDRDRDRSRGRDRGRDRDHDSRPSKKRRRQ
jgi:hypothetical protein